jgi:hypothetical protein
VVLYFPGAIWPVAAPISQVPSANDALAPAGVAGAVVGAVVLADVGAGWPGSASYGAGVPTPLSAAAGRVGTPRWVSHGGQCDWAPQGGHSHDGCRRIMDRPRTSPVRISAPSVGLSVEPDRLTDVHDKHARTSAPCRVSATVWSAGQRNPARARRVDRGGHGCGHSRTTANARAPASIVNQSASASSRPRSRHFERPGSRF